MVIVVQSKNAVMDTSLIIKVTTNKDGGVFATLENNSRETLGEYSNLNEAKFVLGMYSSALASGDNLFYFPSVEDVKARISLQKNRVSKTGISNSHGGS